MFPMGSHKCLIMTFNESDWMKKNGTRELDWKILATILMYTTVLFKSQTYKRVVDDSYWMF